MDELDIPGLLLGKWWFKNAHRPRNFEVFEFFTFVKTSFISKPILLFLRAVSYRVRIEYVRYCKNIPESVGQKFDKTNLTPRGIQNFR